MKSIEQKVRMQLHLERFQLRLDQLRSQLRSLQLALAITVVVIERVADQNDYPIDQQTAIEVVENELKCAQHAEAAATANLNRVDHVIDRDHRNAEAETDQKMKRHAAA